MLQRIFVSDNTHRSLCTGFDPDHGGFVGKETVAVLSELLETFAQPVGNERRYPEVQRRRYQSGGV